jgi:hypothetical protein
MLAGINWGGWTYSTREARSPRRLHMAYFIIRVVDEDGTKRLPNIAFFRSEDDLRRKLAERFPKAKWTYEARSEAAVESFDKRLNLAEGEIKQTDWEWTEPFVRDVP